ncbi:hypothetical protein PoB_000066200 [Plakobranchus ocellatus]|uniref:Uncharacterized protein n=1 Tax=Plakobranchus ocellatus TaxID=259542 RepID=A0AAV3XVL4_9GAST|nr:hypothetical protein PoB_000066200 [Plakobranchus ocellatus]
MEHSASSGAQHHSSKISSASLMNAPSKFANLRAWSSVPLTLSNWPYRSSTLAYCPGLAPANKCYGDESRQDVSMYLSSSGLCEIRRNQRMSR